MTVTEKNTVSIELGRTWLPADDVAHLACGCIIEMPMRAAGDVKLLSGGRPVASGEPMIADGCLAMRIDRVADEGQQE